MAQGLSCSWCRADVDPVERHGLYTSKIVSSDFCKSYSSIFLLFYPNKKSNLLNNTNNISDKNI